MERDKNSKWENLPFPDSKYVSIDILREVTISIYVQKDITIEELEDAIFLACSNEIDLKRKNKYEIVAKWPMWANRGSRVYHLPPTDRYAIREITNRDWPSDTESETETLTEEEEESEDSCEDGPRDCEKWKNLFKK